MVNELVINVDAITVTQGTVKFNEYENLKAQAERLAEKIQEVEVSEDNVKHSKKLLAAVNKKLKELEDRRIAIKKHMLEPYQEFEDQVKQIVKIVKEADTTVREQVKYLEEFERLEKEEAVKELFEKRVKLYSFNKLFGFSDFVKPKHLNKSTSMKAVEEEMVTWLEQRQQDLNVINSLPNAETVLRAYTDTLELSGALNRVQAEERRMRQIEASKALRKEESVKVFRFTVFDRKDYKLVEMFMKEANINYEAEGDL